MSSTDGILASLEEVIELLRENNQLLGELLTQGGEPRESYSAPSDSTATLASAKPLPVPDADDTELAKAIGSLTSPDVSTFWPKARAPNGWVRVSIKHPTEASLLARIAEGCPCGNSIVVKTTENSSFYTCQGVTQRGGCKYRPAAHFDKLTFLCNLPPK